MHFGLRQAQQLRQRGQVVGAQLAEAVIQPVQVLDQQIATQGQAIDGLRHLLQGLGADLPLAAGAPRALARGGVFSVDRDHGGHGGSGLAACDTYGVASRIGRPRHPQRR